jgi:hypothetical protein
MKKRHEIIALLAAAAGLSMAATAEAAVTQRMDVPSETVQSSEGAVTDQVLSRMIQLADTKGFSRSGNPNAAGSPSKSPQGNGKAQGFSNSGNPNAAGSPTKSPQGAGNNPS